MFSLVSNSSKVALANLVNQLINWNFEMIDCQIGTRHLQSMGAREISGEAFSRILRQAVEKPGRSGKWSLTSSAGKTWSV